MTSNKLVWIDTETFGLVPEESPIVEIGLKITDLDLNVKSSLELYVWEDYYNGALEDLMKVAINGDQAAMYVFEMHNRSGLWKEAARFGSPANVVEDMLVDWLRKNGVDNTDPMCGSSVQFDRQMLAYHMPKVHDTFSYRNIDVSTLKELCRRYNWTLYEHLETDTSPAKIHRVLSDLDDTIEEFKFYRDSFLWWEGTKVE